MIGEIEQKCAGLDTQVQQMADGVEDSSRNFSQAKDQLGRLLDVSETLIELSAATGARTDDARFIEAVQRAAAKIGALFEAALVRGYFSEADLRQRTALGRFAHGVPRLKASSGSGRCA